MTGPEAPRVALKVPVSRSEDGEIWVPSSFVTEHMRKFSDALGETPVEALNEWSAAEAIQAVRGWLGVQADEFDVAVIEALEAVEKPE